MKNYDKNITNENIIDTLKNDYIERNSKLNKLIEILLSQTDNKVISIDGNWGSGKTFFVKQLEFLNYELNTILSNENETLSGDLLKKYHDLFVVHYYNAWEMDNHDSPLKSLVFSLLNDFPKFKKYGSKSKTQIPWDIKSFIKNISHDAYNIDKVESYEDLAKEIISVEEQKDSLRNLISEIVPKNKKLILIIDELDRCKPTFAVELLETIKHFFSDDKIIFIVANNSEQLMHSITNFYGSNFDGYGYLNRFFDLVIELYDVDIKKYLKNVCDIKEVSSFYYYSLYSVINYFNFSMRETNRLLSDYDMLFNYFNTNNNTYYNEDNIVKHVFLPYCLAIKIKDKTQLSQFLNGKGINNIINFVSKSEKIKVIIKKECKIKLLKNDNEIDENEIIELLKSTYNNYFSGIQIDDVYLRQEILEQKKDFLETFSLLGSYVKMDNKNK